MLNVQKNIGTFADEFGELYWDTYAMIFDVRVRQIVQMQIKYFYVGEQS